MIGYRIIAKHIVIPMAMQRKTQLYVVIGHRQCFIKATHLPELAVSYQQARTGYGNADIIHPIPAKVPEISVIQPLKTVKGAAFQIGHTHMLNHRGVRI